MNEKKNLTTEETFALAVQNKKKNNLQVAENLYNETLKTNTNYVDAHNNLGNILKELGEHQKAMNYYQKVIQIEPNNLTAHWLSMNNFPVIYKNFDEINTYEEKFEKYIQKINQLLDTQTNYTKKTLISANAGNPKLKK